MFYISLHAFQVKRGIIHQQNGTIRDGKCLAQAKNRDISKATKLSIAVFTQETLGIVLDIKYTILAADIPHCFMISRKAEIVNSHDGFCALINLAHNCVFVYRKVRIDRIIFYLDAKIIKWRQHNITDK